MPGIRLEDPSEILHDARAEVQRRAKRLLTGFSDFALRENVLEVAVGLMYALFILQSSLFSIYCCLANIMVDPSLYPFISVIT
jgi:hypothetical protein